MADSLKTRVRWVEDHRFVATTGSGFSLVLDNPRREGGAAASPMELLLVSLAGCTGVDVVALNGAEGGLLTAGDGVYRWSGRDGSWKRSVSGIARASLSSATVEPGEPWRLLAVSWETGLELSSDGGATWTPAGAGGTVHVPAIRRTSIWPGSRRAPLALRR